MLLFSPNKRGSKIQLCIDDDNVNSKYLIFSEDDVCANKVLVKSS